MASATQVTLGQAANYALFVGSYTQFSYNGPGNIQGNVAMGSHASANWASPATITGTVYLADSSLAGTDSGVNPTGGYVYNTNLTQATTDASNASTNANGLATTTSVTGNNINLTNGNLTVNATTAEPTVLDVTGITLQSGTNLILNGTSADTFIINDSGTFNINGSGSILLTGGITASHVLFNLTGSGGTLLTVAGGGNGTINGTILALNTSVSIHDDTFNGAIIAGFGSSGNTFTIQDTSGFNINYQPFSPSGTVPEPATLGLLGFGISGLVAARKRAQN